ncbi:MAG: hypothetical protein WCI90_08540 [Chlorobium sp.]|nr:MAG: hypothetical protein FDX17_07610 [Chlorobium sp.]
MKTQHQKSRLSITGKYYQAEEQGKGSCYTGDLGKRWALLDGRYAWLLALALLLMPCIGHRTQIFRKLD